MDYVSRLDFQINRLGYRFQDVDLLEEALTHGVTTLNTEFPNKNRSLERLSAVGNSVLKFVISQYVIQVSDFVEEGLLDNKKQLLINKTTQTEVGLNLICPDGEENADIINKTVRIHSANWKSGAFKVPYHQFVKAILGAVFVDAGGTSGDGVENSMKVFIKLWKSFLVDDLNPNHVQDLGSRFGKSTIFKESVTKLNILFGVEFENPNFLFEALIHKSFYDVIRNNPDMKNRHLPDYQRLEFLGDSVLELVVAEFVFKNYSNYGSKNIDKKVESYTTDDFLLGIADKYKVETCVLKGQSFDVRNITCDIMEAIIGAIYIDGGIGKAREFILRGWELVPLTQLKPSYEDLECKLGFRFKVQGLLETALTHQSVLDSVDEKNRFKRFVEIGRGLIEFYASDYVVRTSKANAKTGALDAQRSYLCGNKVVRSIANYLNLNQLVKICPSLSGFVRYEIFVYSIFGMIFNSGGIGVITAAAEVFYRIWNPHLQHSPKSTLLDCFSLDPQVQHQLREKLNYEIPAKDFKSIEECIGGHKFVHRCILEQALTDRSSRSYATDINTGDSTKFDFLGKSIVNFLKSWDCLKNTELYEWMLIIGIEPINAWKSSYKFRMLQKYYVHPKYWTLNKVMFGQFLFYPVLASIFIDTPGGWEEKYTEIIRLYHQCIKRFKKDYTSKNLRKQMDEKSSKNPSLSPHSTLEKEKLISAETLKVEYVPFSMVKPFNPQGEMKLVNIPMSRLNNALRESLEKNSPGLKGYLDEEEDLFSYFCQQLHSANPQSNKTENTSKNYKPTNSHAPGTSTSSHNARASPSAHTSDSFSQTSQVKVSVDDSQRIYEGANSRKKEGKFVRESEYTSPIPQRKSQTTYENLRSEKHIVAYNDTSQWTSQIKLNQDDSHDYANSQYQQQRSNEPNIKSSTNTNEPGLFEKIVGPVVLMWLAVTLWKWAHDQ